MNADEKFVHLHVHTEYSLLDGLSQIDRLMSRASELEMPSLAITDHGVMFGVVDFFRAAKKHNIKPIIGMEAYLSKRGMEDRDPKLDKRPYHMLLLAKNQTGYRNLLKLASEAQLRGYYYQPRIDREFMAAHSEGIIATSGCLGAQIPQSIMNGNDDEARELIGWYQEVFGPENFYLELQYHDIDVLERVNKWLADYRKSGHTPVQWAATNDVHYVLESDHDPHDTLLCIQTGNLKAEGNRMSMSDPSYHLTSHEEMEHIISTRYGWLPPEMRHEALLNTARIADMCDVDLETEGYHLPRFPVPGDYTERDYLRYLVDKGRYWRYGDDADRPVYVERMEHELGIIDSMGFNTYFLIVWDLCEFARHADIWWNVRGSGAGSMVAYCLGITNLDPIQNSLIFERFLNPGRVSMPDIDLDYPDDRRNEMIEYTARKYGSDKVAAIITFGTMGAKAAIRDVGRALDVPLAEVNKTVSLIPTEARQKKIEEYVEANPELRQIYKQDKQIQRVIDTAKVLQGVARHASTHAAGVIVADEPLVNYLPLHRLTSSSKDDGEESALNQVTQFPMETCESLGLLKVDFLGLSTLTILRRASDLIHRHHNKRWTMENIPYRPHQGDNLTEEQQRENQMLAEAFEMMGRGETVGVFQVESVGMQQMLRGMKPKTYEHIVAGISLYRPGPMDYIPTFNDRMHGKEEVSYLHPKLEPILKETYSIIVYQEQIMQIASELFGYELGEADLMRRAVSKKKQKELVKHKQIFLERGPENGIPKDVSEKIFDDIEFFANYGFNKCLTADTQITDADTGAVHTIADIVNGHAHITNAFTCDIDNMKITTAPVIDAVFNGVRPVYELTTRAGRNIKATGNHPLLTQNGWVNLEKLVIGSAVAVPQRVLVTDGVDTAHEQGVDWDEIVSIKYAGEEAVYDLEIEGIHNFVANDIIVHNSHAADYAMVTVQTGFLKCHYPAEYMAALLSVYREDTTKVSSFLEECGRLEIPILPPDVNHSNSDFDIQTLDDGTRGIRFGLAAIKNAGVGAVNVILAERKDNGPFADLTGFAERVDLRLVGKRTLESLVKVGALDSFADNRNQLLSILDQLVSFSTDHHKAKEVGQISMFGAESGIRDEIHLPALEATGEKERLNWEKELLGFYITDHPVDAILRKVDAGRTMRTFHFHELDSFNKGKNVTMIALIAEIREIPTRNGNMMAVLTMEDRYGSLEVVMFPRTWEGFKHIVREKENDVVLIRGTFDMRNDRAQIIVDSVTDKFDRFVSEEITSANGAPPADPPPNGYTPPAPPDDDDEGPPPRDWGAAENGNGAPTLTNGNGYASAVTPDEPVPASEPALPAPSNSGIDWEAELKSDPHLGETHSEDRPNVGVVVYLQPDDDADKTRRRLRRIHGQFMEYSGDDRFMIILERAGQNYRMEFPNHRTGWCDTLRDSLVAIVGEDNIQVFDDS